MYLADHAETQFQALKRKHDESQQENLIYKELYRLLVSVSEAEALDILQRLRSGTDVETAVRLAQDGELLLQLALKPESRLRYHFPYLPSMPAPLQTSDNLGVASLLFASIPAQAPAAVAAVKNTNIKINICRRGSPAHKLQPQPQPHLPEALPHRGACGRLPRQGQGLRMDLCDDRRQPIQAAAACIPVHEYCVAPERIFPLRSGSRKRSFMLVAACKLGHGGKKRV